MNPLWSTHRLGLIGLFGVLAASGGCGPQASHTGAKPIGSVGGYLTPPTLKSARREADGGVHLVGLAPPNAAVGLHAPDGGQFAAHSDASGSWSLDLPPAGEPRLFAFDAKNAAQTVRGEGALAVIPAPGAAAVILRAGYAAAATGKTPGGLNLVAFDYDGGGAAAGGFAPPGAPVRLSIDGAIVGLSKADAEGRFAVLAIDPRRGVPAGQHTVRIETPDGLAVQRRITVAVPSIPADKAFLVTRIDGGWTLSWRLPGGGAQSSVVFDAAGAQPGPSPSAAS